MWANLWQLAQIVAKFIKLWPTLARKGFCKLEGCHKPCWFGWLWAKMALVNCKRCGLVNVDQLPHLLKLPDTCRVFSSPCHPKIFRVFKKEITPHLHANIHCSETLSQEKVMVSNQLLVVSCKPWKAPWIVHVAHRHWPRRCMCVAHCTWKWIARRCRNHHIILSLT